MKKIVIKGPNTLTGEVKVSGAKNAVLPILFSTLLAKGKHEFTNTPDLKDVDLTLKLLDSFGAKTTRQESCITVDTSNISNTKAPYELVKQMRASILCLGPLVSKWGEALVSLPGGCAIGTRPINQHIEGLKSLGADIQIKNGYVSATALSLTGSRIVFDGVSVGGTENILMAAVLAKGTTVIENAAKEPEINDLITYLKKMGAKIEGVGTSVLEVEGVDKLTPETFEIMPDRIEAGTFLIAGAITKGNVKVICEPKHLDALTRKLKEAGFNISSGKDYIQITPGKTIGPVDVTTAPYPGFATDLQAQFMALMTQACGSSVITETIFENRFMHVSELNRLGANITSKTTVAIIRGKKDLCGAQVMATDLRASASLVIAGLAAKGTTIIHRAYHIDRGYEKIQDKLKGLTANIYVENT